MIFNIHVILFITLKIDVSLNNMSLRSFLTMYLDVCLFVFVAQGSLELSWYPKVFQESPFSASQVLVLEVFATPKPTSSF